MLLLVPGVVMFACASALNLLGFLDLTKAGHDSHWSIGGPFDYNHYRQIVEKNGWAHWPVYCMSTLCTSGVALTVLRFLIEAGALRGL